MTVLVTGATGNVGSQVVRELRERGVPLRAFVRDRDRATAALGEDVELAVGDFSAPDSIRHALAGVDRVFLACGNVPGQVGCERDAIDAAKAAGVTRIVKLSAAGAALDSPLLFPRRQGEIERHLAESGLPAVLLHPRILMSNLLASAEPVRQTGKLFAPAGAATIAFIHPRDIAATAAGARAGSPFPAAVRALAGGVARAAATPFAPLTLAALTPGGAVARAAILRAGPEPRREIPRLRAGLARLGGSGFDGRLRVTAVDRSSGKRVVFGAPGAPQAEIAEAVLASCAVPWLFRPVTIGGRTYVDGGAWSAANLDVAPVSRGSEVLCLNPTASSRLASDPLGAVRRFATATTAAEALALRRRGARVRIVAPDDASVAAIGPDLFDPRRRGDVEAAGYAQGRVLAG